MTGRIWVAIVSWAATSLAVVGVAYNLTTTEVNSVTSTDWKAFAIIAGVGVTLLTSIFGAIFSLLSQVQQQDASHSIELLKHQVSALRQATDAVYAAASSYYHTLAQMETGKFDQAQVDDCEKICIQATGYLKDVPEEAKEKWYEFWTRARQVSEDAGQDGADPKAIWTAEAKNIGSALKDLETHIRRAQNASA
tara:strand:+ start:2290 stop:2871 length:582 start_codon:yes stop_codon:yes gene_type:complete